METVAGAVQGRRKHVMEYFGAAKKIEDFRVLHGVAEDELIKELAYLNVYDYRRGLMELAAMESTDMLYVNKRGKFICLTILDIERKKKQRKESGHGISKTGNEDVGVKKDGIYGAVVIEGVPNAGHKEYSLEGGQQVEQSYPV